MAELASCGLKFFQLKSKWTIIRRIYLFWIILNSLNIYKNWNHWILNFVIKASLIDRDLSTQFWPPSFVLPCLVMDFESFLNGLWVVDPNWDLLLKFLSSFFAKDYSMYPTVSSMPPSSLIFFATLSACLS